MSPNAMQVPFIRVSRTLCKTVSPRQAVAHKASFLPVSQSAISAISQLRRCLPHSSWKKAPWPTAQIRSSGCALSHARKAGTRCRFQSLSFCCVGVQLSSSSANPLQFVIMGNESASVDLREP
eukprot:4364200-Prymnesium_polylepis.2